MKKQILLVLGLCFLGIATVQAQGGGRMMNRRTVEERVAMMHGKIDSAFKLDAAKMTEVDSVFATYYRGQDNLREEMMNGGGQRPDMQAIRAKMQPLTETRDKQLQELLGNENFKKFKDEIEPSMRPQRGPGGGGGFNRQRDN